MRYRALVASIIVIAVSGACGHSTASPGPHTAPTNRAATPSTAAAIMTTHVDQTALQLIAERYRDACKSPGAAVGLRTSDGATRFALAGQLAPRISLRRDSQFLAGSVTKLFVATVALQLVASRALSLDNTVAEYLPGWPRGDRITVAMLLGHRSGMGDFGNDFSEQLTSLVLSDLNRVFQYDEVLALVRVVAPVAQPGTAYHYSNANYIVLGAILQRVAHTSLGRLFQQRIIERLGLSRTFYAPDDLAAASRVVYHGLFDVSGTGNPIDIGTLPRAAALTVDPAGAGLFSSLPDLLTVTHALFATVRLLAGAQRTELDNAVSTLDAGALLLGPRYVIHGHGGASPGAQTITAYDSAHENTVSVWCNRLDPGANELLASVIAARDTFQLAARPSAP